MGGGFFGEPGTYGERDNKILFRRGMRTLETVSSAFELLAVQMYVEDIRHQYENNCCTFSELAKARELAKKLMEARFQEKEEK